MIMKFTWIIAVLRNVINVHMKIRIYANLFANLENFIISKVFATLAILLFQVNVWNVLKKIFVMYVMMGTSCNKYRQAK